MMWADNYWIFSDDQEKLTWMVNDIIEQLMDGYVQGQKDEVTLHVTCKWYLNKVRLRNLGPINLWWCKFTERSCQ